MLELKQRQAFYLQGIMAGIPTDELGEVDGSPYKAVTKRRKVVQIIKEANKDFGDLLDKITETRKKYGEQYEEYKKEVGETFEKKKSSLKKPKDAPENWQKDEEAKLMSEQEEESKTFADELDKKLSKELEEVLGIRILTYIVGNTGRRAEQVEFVNDDEKVVQIDLDKSQLEFVKEKYEQHAIKLLPFEDVVVDIGEAIGL